MKERYSAINAKLSFSDSAEAIRLQREAEETYRKMTPLYKQLQQLEKQLAAESQPLPATALSQFADVFGR